MKDAIQDVIAKNPLGFKEKMNNILMDKLKERLDVERISVANKLFSNPEDTAVDDEEDDVDDEDDEE